MAIFEATIQFQFDDNEAHAIEAAAKAFEVEPGDVALTMLLQAIPLEMDLGDPMQVMTQAHKQ